MGDALRERDDCLIGRHFFFCVCVSIVEKRSINIFVSLKYYTSNGRIFEGYLVCETVCSGCCK